MTRLLDHVELEDPLDCFSCGGLYDLRFWRVLSDEVMQCPECRAISRIDAAIALTIAKTNEWSRKGAEASPRVPQGEGEKA